MAKEELLEMDGVVDEVLPDSRFRVTLDNGHTLVAYSAGKMRKNHIRIIAGDTAVAFEMGGEPRDFPPEALAATFARYLGEIAELKRGVTKRDAYAPYEIRIATALVRMGRREDAWDVLRLMLDGRRPRAWNQWPEIVWSDETKGQWLGDLPHSWIGSTFLHAVRTALVYERASDQALVLAAGVPAAWIAGAEPLRVARLSTWWGPLMTTSCGGRARLPCACGWAADSGFRRAASCSHRRGSRR